MRTLKLAITSATALLAASCASGPDYASMGRLGWMVGCWESADGANRETWSPPSAGVMFGAATTTENDELAFFEQTRIMLNSQPATYVASPNGARAVTFVENPDVPALEGVPQIAFDNAQNEYPQRIAYRSPGRDRLAATVSQLDGSRPTQYSWTRCAS